MVWLPINRVSGGFPAMIPSTYARDPLKDFVGVLCHVGGLPPVWEVAIPVARMRFPPQRTIDCLTTA